MARNILPNKRHGKCFLFLTEMMGWPLWKIPIHNQVRHVFYLEYQGTMYLFLPRQWAKPFGKLNFARRSNCKRDSMFSSPMLWLPR